MTHHVLDRSECAGTRATPGTWRVWNFGYAASVFALTANVPYNFGVVTQLLDEIYEFNTFNTSAVRNIYSPDVCIARRS